MSGRMKPIIVVGAGPVGLTTALGLDFYGLPFQLFEEDAELSRDTKAGTILTRTLEAFRRYGVADQVLAKALRVDEIGDVERATNTARPSVQTALLAEDTRYPFVINMPQHHLEPILREAIDRAPARGAASAARADVVPAARRWRRRQLRDARRHPRRRRLLSPGLRRRPQHGARAARRRGRGRVARTSLPAGRREGRSRRRESARLSVSRLFRRPAGVDDPGTPAALLAVSVSARPPASPSRGAEEFRDKVLRFIGPVDQTWRSSTPSSTAFITASRREWRSDRVFLMGDAAHLITPMWALGLNTGILDAISLPWRLAWVARGWADRCAARWLCARAAAGRRRRAPARWRKPRANTWRDRATQVRAMSGSAHGPTR